MNELKQGIYLQQVITKIGTGVTSSNREVKNYYLLRPAARGAEAFLLTDNLELTGLRETLSFAELRDFHYQADLHERFIALSPGLGPAPKGAAPQAPPQAPAAPEMAAPPPQTGAPDKPKPKKKAPWWESTREGAGKLLDKK